MAEPDDVAPQSRVSSFSRKRRIRRSIVWWERFGVIVSTIATVLAAAAVVASFYQAGVMSEQLTSGDRNRSYQVIMERAAVMCSLLDAGKLGSRVYDDSDAEAAKVVIVRGKIDESIYSWEFANDYHRAARELRTAFQIAKIWTNGRQAETINDLQSVIFNDVLMPFSVGQLWDREPGQPIKDDFSRDEVATAYARAEQNCNGFNNMEDTFNIGDYIGEWIRSGNAKNDFAAVDYVVKGAAER